MLICLRLSNNSRRYPTIHVAALFTAIRASRDYYVEMNSSFTWPRDSCVPHRWPPLTGFLSNRSGSHDGIVALSMDRSIDRAARKIVSRIVSILFLYIDAAVYSVNKGEQL